MRRALAPFAVALAVACGHAVDESPTVEQVGVRDGKEPVVRVHLRSLPAKGPLRVSGKQGLIVETEGGAATAGDAAVVLEPTPHGQVRVGGVTRARVVLRPLAGIVTVDGHSYSGKLVWEDGKLVNHVSFENYVLGVLRGELPLKAVPKQAAAAQAIAVRSYTMHYLAQDRAVFDVDDTTLYQRYVGVKYAPDDASLRAGVRATAGLYLEYRGRPLKAYYHSTCGGHTTDVPTGLSRAAVAPMSGVPCEFCKISKYWRWKAQLADSEIIRAARAGRGALRDVEVQRGPGDRATAVRVKTDRVTVARASDFRLAVGPSKLRSTRIVNLERVDGGYVVNGAGWGHGVGLCQMGAIGQARQGKTAREIVAHYYPGAQIKRAY